MKKENIMKSKKLFKNVVMGAVLSVALVDR